MALVNDGFLGALDTILGIEGVLGLNPIAVTIRVNSYTGGRPQAPGTVQTTVDTVLKVGQGQNPCVEQISTREAIASGGRYTNQMLRVGPLTPAYLASISTGAGGVGFDTFEPPVAGGVIKEVLYRVVGPMLPAGGVWFELVQTETTDPLQFFIVLRRSGNQNP